MSTLFSKHLQKNAAPPAPLREDPFAPGRSGHEQGVGAHKPGGHFPDEKTVQLPAEQVLGDEEEHGVLGQEEQVRNAQEQVEEAYRDRDRWARMALLQTASCGKFSSDRTIQEYVDDIWHLDKITVEV